VLVAARECEYGHERMCDLKRESPGDVNLKQLGPREPAPVIRRGVFVVHVLVRV